MSETVFILSGSNIGDREKNLALALEKMHLIEGLEVVATSAIYVSEAQDMDGENPSFMNQVIMADYRYSANELLNG
ncbi:MAG: 2-amino-4-hydroxy-6-hydroxymethyldihydropteridine diphosphokinase, partial [candidate division Zixibacteria bacterium]|nr:2-amino-4-hydroxy-6-hydroxymethyldihydropteridine diphosphokinase [candidate division Zixibacteria bacterium]